MAAVDEILLNEDFEALKETEEAKRWTLGRGDSLEVSAKMSPQGSQSEVYWAVFRWKTYPGSLPSLKFRNLATGSEVDPEAWPVLPGFRPASLDTCVHWTAEGHGVHPEWANGSATKHCPAGNVVFRSLCFLQDELDFTNQGRFKK
jgi:hypothetical protein